MCEDCAWHDGREALRKDILNRLAQEPTIQPNPMGGFYLSKDRVLEIVQDGAVPDIDPRG